MAFLTDIFNVWMGQSFVILLFLGLILWGTTVTTCWFEKSTTNRLTIIEYCSLGISGCLIPLLFWALLSQPVMRAFEYFTPVILLACLFIPFLFWDFKNMRVTKAAYPLLPALAILLVYIAVNMAFISQAIFPAYLDSPEHYRIIHLLLETDGPDWPVSRYYHPGYHLILAAFTRFSNTGIVDAMLVSGQIALSILSLSLFFIVKRETASDVPAFFTTLLAGFGWYMPAHAINWGKYPAIFGLISSIFVFNLIYLMLQNNTSWPQRSRLLPLLLTGVLTAGLIHTRSLIICALFATALLSANLWSTFEKNSRRSIFGVFLFILFACGIHLRNDVTFSSLISSYVQEDLPTLLPASLLGVFAIWKFPKLSLALLLFTGMLFGCVYIPMPSFFGYQNLFLLDRPYVQILLHIPLSIISGLGVAGILQASSRLFTGRVRAGLIIQALAFGLLAMNAIFYQEYRPSSCCQLAGRDDAAAFSWIQHELPQATTLLIASQDLSFTQDQSQFAKTGVDAGIWISPMTGRKTLFPPIDTDLTHTPSYWKLCRLGVRYIYVGNRPESFNESDLIKRPKWYQVVFALPDAKIYRLMKCR
jgi:hypothetical protein